MTEQLNMQAQGYKTLLHWKKGRHIDQWNRTASPEVNIYGYLTLTRVPRAFNWERIIFSVSYSEMFEYPHIRGLI